MIEVDPTSLEGPWQLMLGDEPPAESDPMISFRDGQVCHNDTAIASYTVAGAELRYATRDKADDGAVWTTAYTFALPGPLASGEPGLFGVELVRPDDLSGTAETIEQDDAGDGARMSQPCVLVRVGG